MSAMHIYTCWQNCPTHAYKHPPMVPPPTRLLFIPPSSRHTPMSASHLRLRMKCAAAAYSNLTLPFALAVSLPFAILPFVTILAAMRATSRIGWKKLRATTAVELPMATNTASLMPEIPEIVTNSSPCNP